MATNLDLEEQEQLAEFKHFWKKYGNLLTWLMIAVLGSFATWNFYHYWHRQQAQNAAIMFDTFELVASKEDVDNTLRAYTDMRDRFSNSVYTIQAGLLTAQQAYNSGKLGVSQDILNGLVSNTEDLGYQSIARLRLANILIEKKNYDSAESILTKPFPRSFESMAFDRLGDLYTEKKSLIKALEFYRKAYLSFPSDLQYRRLIEVKLNKLGVDHSSISNK